jgi:sugar lactone lactonase YvrE
VVCLAFTCACSEDADSFDGGPKDGGGGTSSGGAGNGGSSNGGGGGSGGNTGGGAGSANGGSGGTGGSAGATTGFQCPPNSETLVLDLNGVSLAKVDASVPSFGTGFQFFEGPVWLEGSLYVTHLETSDVPNNGRILKLNGNAFETFVDNPGTNGLAISGTGDLLVARQADGSISTIDLQNPSAAPVVVAGEYGNPPDRFNSPNDLVRRSDGNIYFTDPSYQNGDDESPQGGQFAYRIAPNGEVTRLSDTPSRPNGITLSLDEDTLYIGGTNGVRSYSVDGQGVVGTTGTPFGGLNGGSDGMGKDCAGNIYVTGGSSVRVRSPSGSDLGTINLASGINLNAVTNVAFGGPDGTTLYATGMPGSGSPVLLSASLNVPGYPY